MNQVHGHGHETVGLCANVVDIVGAFNTITIMTYNNKILQ
jgi:hypothetical protein